MWTDWLCTVNTIAIEDERSSGLIKGIEFGTIHPGEASTKLLYLSMSGAAGPRIIDISIQSRVDTGGITQNDSEILKTVTVQSVLPFSWETDVTYFHPVESPAPWLDLSQIDAERHRVAAEALMAVKLKLEAPWDIFVQSIRLVEKVRVGHSQDF
jgi:trafficking protein particle complex subunit 11